MYGQGNGTPGSIVAGVPAVAGVTTAALLPRTGMNMIIEIALVAAAVLVVWGAVYALRALRAR